MSMDLHWIAPDKVEGHATAEEGPVAAESRLPVDEALLKRVVMEALREVLGEAWPHGVSHAFPAGMPNAQTPYPARIEIRVLQPRLELTVRGTVMTFRRRPSHSMELLAALALLPVHAYRRGGNHHSSWNEVPIDTLGEALRLRQPSPRESEADENRGWLGVLERRLFHLRRAVLLAPDALWRANGKLAINRSLCRVDLWDVLDGTELEDPAGDGRPESKLHRQHAVRSLLEEERWGSAAWLVTTRKVALKHLRRLDRRGCSH